ncbi:hypothetical protein CHLRE_16g674550v5 [Chlamydomonas reinhardtii]|uniref:Cyclic nucleotide-binding domain-containing protein n=1 Tax=Chlamydomonas reinhardtii TaxID=3055 RepID=A0A2K3CVH6_CHLRE|nr:uncharacterized protein CHLRE_16g674550v5 [Chlamydomonas reinhardtii]PNW72285.1 hypothetical protein CHLRE_16g674550v5 [Chlamydomonas reinhardtii]
MAFAERHPSPRSHSMHRSPTLEHGGGGGGGGGEPGSPAPRLQVHRDWLHERPPETSVFVADEDVRNAAEGAFSVLAQFGVLAAASPQSPLAKWRRSAIRIAAGSAARRLREAARLKALQRTPYPLVLARIKLLLDRMAAFKEQVALMSSSGGGGGPHSGLGGAGAKSRRRGAPPWGGDGGGGGVGGVGGGGGGGGVAGSPTGPDGTVRTASDLLTSTIKSWDLSKVGGHLISGPMEVLSRKASKLTRENTSITHHSVVTLPAGAADGDGSGRNTASPTAMAAGGGGAGVGVASFRMAANAVSAGAGPGNGGEEGYGGEGEYDDGGGMEQQALELDEPGGGAKMSLDKLLEELSATLSYVSEFLRRVPEETRMEACFAAKMENYKKDQTVYRIGDPPERFHLILTGVVEVWTHPPGNRREKTLIATLKKGQSFGEMAILNDEPRAEVATPTSNCTFLTFQRSDLLAIFGAYFRERLLAAEQFFHSQVAVFQALPKSHTLSAISHMMLTTHPAGKDWEPLNDQQVYFIKSGTADLEALDRRFAGGPATAAIGAAGAAQIGATRGANAAAVSAAAGGAAALDIPDADGNEVLSAISVVDGRAVGTLGQEDELRRARRALIPKKTVASLTAGSHFGGGARILGEGELQGCIKVTAASEMQVYHMHVDAFLKAASPELVRALRDDTAFKLTYYFGRQGTIGQDTVVGHADASLAARPGGLQEEESLASPSRGANSAGRNKKKGGGKGGKGGGGGGSNELDRAVAYMREVEGLLHPDNKPVDLYKNGTPVERYYRSPLLSGTARGNALPHIIAAVYSEGLGPLADKVEALASKAARRMDSGGGAGDASAVKRMLSIVAPSGAGTPLGGSAGPSPTGHGHGHGHYQHNLHHLLSPSALGPGAASRGGSPAGGGGGGAGGSPPQQPRPNNHGTTFGAPVVPGGSGVVGSVPNSPIGRAGPTRLGGGHAAGGGASAAAAISAAAGSAGAAGAPVPEPWAGAGAGAGAARTSLVPGPSPTARPQTSPAVGSYGAGGAGAGGGYAAGGGDAAAAAAARRRGALTAAGFIWQRMRDLGGRAPPAVRQCLTYDEIAHIKAEQQRALAAGSSPGHPARSAAASGMATPVPARYSLAGGSNSGPVGHGGGGGGGYY